MSMLGKKYPWSKWKKHLALSQDPELEPYLPATAYLTARSFHQFMGRYPVIFVKPCFGGGGRGVMRISRLGRFVQIYTTESRFEVPVSRAYAEVRRLSNGKSCIVQQGVDLIRKDGGSIDFRTLLFRPDSEWRFMGIMGKIGEREQIVTNHCRGGSSITLKEALKGSIGLSDDQIHEVGKKIESLSLRIAETLNEYYPLVAELGLDIGVDNQLSLWLIEANTRPQYKLFRDHEDPSRYRRIERLIRQLRMPLTKKPSV